VEHVIAKYGVSERLACRVLGQHRSTQRKIPQQPDDEAALTADITGKCILRSGEIIASTGVLQTF
jgi:hypothetical protein